MTCPHCKHKITSRQRETRRAKRMSDGEWWHVQCWSKAFFEWAMEAFTKETR